MINIYVLAENTSCDPKFACEHGLSLYIEALGHKILFDSGQTAAFADNAALLGVDLSKADAAVLSHGHYDHGGGLEKFLEINKTAPVYINEYAFGDFYNGTEKYIGLSKKLRDSGRIVFTGDEFSISCGLQLCTCRDGKEIYPHAGSGLKEKRSGKFSDDLFLHEQYLIINDAGRKIVLSGCSHRGVLNIAEWLEPDLFIGGFHFMKQPVPGGEAVLDNAAECLSGRSCVYYTCHCTGTAQYGYLKKKMGDRLHYISAGEVITL